jgi:hypothetical protein
VYDLGLMCVLASGRWGVGGGLVCILECIGGVEFWLVVVGEGVVCLWTRLGGILNVSYSLGCGKPIGCDPERGRGKCLSL